MRSKPNIEQAASNFCSVCGVLAGFAGTLIVLLLTTNTGTNTIQNQDWVLATFLIGAALYINGASILGNVPRASSTNRRVYAYNFGLGLFLLANVLFAYAFSLLLSGLSFRLASAVARFFTLASALIFIFNILWPSFIKLIRRVIRKKQRIVSTDRE